MNWYLEVLKKYAVFNGRARRKEFWMFLLFNILIFYVISFTSMAIAAILGIGQSSGVIMGATLGAFIGFIYKLAMMIPTLAVSVRRMHDLGRNGWWILLPIVNIVFYCLDSQPGENEYGPNPKEEPDPKNAGRTSYREESKLFVATVIGLPILVAVGVIAFAVIAVRNKDKVTEAEALHKQPTVKLLAMEASSHNLSSKPAPSATPVPTIPRSASSLLSTTKTVQLKAPSNNENALGGEIAKPLPASTQNSESNVVIATAPPPDLVPDAPVSQAARHLNMNTDIRYCLNLNTNEAIIACTSK